MLPKHPRHFFSQHQVGCGEGSLLSGKDKAKGSSGQKLWCCPRMNGHALDEHQIKAPLTFACVKQGKKEWAGMNGHAMSEHQIEALLAYTRVQAELMERVGLWIPRKQSNSIAYLRAQLG